MADKDNNSSVASGVNTNPATVQSSPEKRQSIQKKIWQFEKLISGFSAALIDTPEQKLENELNDWLKKFVEFLNVDRCIVTEFLDDPERMHVLMNYTVPEVDAVPVVYDYIPSEGVIKEHKKGNIIWAEKIPDDLPQEFRGGLIEKDNTKSLVIVPLSIGNNIVGNLSFSCYRKKRKWSDDLVRRIKLIAEVIANAIQRIQSHKNLLQVIKRREVLEERYSTILKNANVGFLISDFDQNILEVNDEYCRMTGYSREELLLKKIWQIDASMDSDKVNKESEKLEKNIVNRIVTSHRKKDGSLIDVEASGSLFKKEGLICNFVRDITDLNIVRKQLEERLAFEELISGFSAALISPDDYLCELNDWVMKFVKYLAVDRGIIIEHLEDLRTIRVLVQYTVPGLDITPFEEFHNIPDEEIDGFQQGMFLLAEKIPEDLPEKLRGGPIEKDGTKSVIMVPLSVGSRAIGTLTFASHISEHKWSDEVVRRIRLIGEIIANAILRRRSSDALIEEVNRRKILEERYSSIIKNANIGFWISDKDQNILVVNDEYCRLSGYSREELLSIKIPDIDATFYKEQENITDDILRRGAAHHEVTHRKKDGDLMNLDVSSTLLKRENLLFSFMRDVTELNKTRREQEERLKFEELVSEFSAALINIKIDDLIEELKKWIIKFVDFLEIGRGVINEYDYERNIIKALVNYTDPVSAVETSPHGMELKTSDTVMNEFKKGAVIRAEEIPEDLPEPFRGWIIEKHNTKSLIVVPLISENKIIGNLTFASYIKKRKWSDDIFNRIKLVGEMIASAILRKRSHDALNEEMEQRKLLEERYTSVIKNADLGFMVSDLNSIILDVNEAYCEMSCYSRDELLGMNVAQLDTSLLDQNVFTQEKKEILKKSGLYVETHHRRKDGTIFDVALSSNFLEKEELVFNFIRDITASNQAKKEQAERLKFEELVSEFSTALINIRPDDIITELGKWLEKFVGLIDADRGAVNEYSDDQKIIYNLIQYSVSEAQAPIPDQRKTPEGEIIELEKGIIKVEKIPEDLPRMFRESYVEKSDAKSLIIVPLYTGNRIFGNLAFTNYRKECRWSDELIRRVKLIAEIVGNAILRLRSHETLLEEIERRHVLEDRYSSIIKTANVGFMISDMNASILDVNDAYCEMSGYNRDELIGMKIYQLDATGDSVKVNNDKNEIFKTGSFHHETIHMRKDGKVINVLISANLLENEGIIFSFIRDVTELNKARKELEERLKFEELVSEFSAALINVKIQDNKNELNLWLRRFAELMNVDRCAIGQYEKDFTIYRFICTYSNPGLEPAPPPFPSTIINDEMYGLEKILMNGDFIKIESPGDELPDCLKTWKQKILNEGTKSLLMLPLMAGDKLLGSMVIASLTHEKRWTQDLIRRLRLVVEIFSNAHMRENSDLELDNYRKHLEKMVEERTARLEEAQKELVLSEKMATLGRLTATVSHELRNPLGTIRSSVFSVQRRLEGQDEKVVNALDRAERNIQRCDLIIDELLNYSRVQDLKLEATPIDIWLSEVLEETKPSKGISIKKRLNSNSVINMDKERFRRSVVNILINAYQAIQEKGAGDRGYVLVKTHQDKSKLTIEISDNGIGFDMEERDKLFEPLYSTKTYGVGLGIPITRQIIEQHGWQIDITGEPQKGATVIITIPI